ncbi:YcaO-like family protein [Brachybacterium sp. DNPG3]
MSAILRSDDLLPLQAAVGVTRLADVTGLDTLGVPVVSAIRPGSRSLAVMSGRGTAPEQARIAAIMEALEAQAAETVAPPCLRARATELEGPHVVPAELPHRPEGALDGELWWCTGRGLLSGAAVHVPFEAVHTDWTRPTDPSGLAVDSAGIGAGTSREAAIRHGLLELVERDALALATARAVAGGLEPPVLSPVLDPAAIGPATRDLAAALGAAGALVRLVDLRSATGIPALCAIVLDERPSPVRPLPVALGTAAGPDPDATAVRALTEAAQSRLVTIAGGRDDLSPSAYRRMLDPQAEHRLRERLAAAGADGDPAAGSTTGSVTDSATVAGDLRSLAEAVRRTTGREPVVVDLGRFPAPDLEVRVVRVLAPGLEGSGAAYGSACAPGPRARAILAGDAAADAGSGGSAVDPEPEVGV